MKNFKFLFVLTILFNISCTKEFEEIKTNQIDKSEYIFNQNKVFTTGINIQEIKSNNIDYYNNFDWENTHRIVFKYNGKPYNISMFHSGSFASGYMDPDSRYNYKKNDGWRLVYNWFPNNQDITCDFPGFLLYNIYTGILKLYYFHIGQVRETGTVLAVLSLYNSQQNTKIFNFATNIDATNIDINAKSVVVSANGSGFFEGEGLMNNCWYSFEWNVSYFEKNFNLSNQFLIGIWSQNISELKNSTITKNLNGSLISTSYSKNWTALATSNSLKEHFANSSSALVKTILPSEIIKSEIQSIKNKSKGSFIYKFDRLINNLNNLALLENGTLESFVKEPIGKMIGIFFYASETNSIKKATIRLKTDLHLNLSETNSMPQYGTAIALSFPQKPEYPSCYAGKFGVYRLKSKPIVKIKEGYTYYGQGDNQQIYTQNYHYYIKTEINKSDILNSIELNPAVLQNAKVEYDAEVVYIHAPQFALPIIYNNINDVIPILNSDKVIISDPYSKFDFEDNPPYLNFIRPGASTAPDPVSSYYIRFSSLRENNFRVKVTLKISPNNGADPVYHTNYFIPKIVRNQKYDPIPKVVDPNYGGGGIGVQL